MSIGVDDLTLSVEVRDDGIGGAVIDGSGSGLAGLADRVGALGGRMDVVSPPGRGTTLRAEIPVGPAGLTAAVGLALWVGGRRR